MRQNPSLHQQNSNEEVQLMVDRIGEIERHMILLGISKKAIADLSTMIRAHATVAPDADPAIHPQVLTAEIGQIARTFHKSSLRRGEALHYPISDPGWNMLLALVTDATEYRTSCVTSLCCASGSPMTTALRHLSRLERDGKIQRREDRHDSRKCVIEATPETLEIMRDLIVSFCVEPPLH
ncbi:MAG: hypothetical protein ACOY4N_09450 [Pseudomonadota bacterium]